MVVGTTTAVTGGLTIGYVVWLLRGGSLIAAMLSSLPAWRLVDPLPILDDFEKNNATANADSLGDMLSV